MAGLKVRVSRNIKNLFLDPNNYRFVDNIHYERIENEKLTDEKIQRRTRGFIEGTKREKIRELIDSFKANGYLKVDVIQLRDPKHDRYTSGKKYKPKKSQISIAGQLQFSGMNNSVIILKSDYIKRQLILQDVECKKIAQLILS